MTYIPTKQGYKPNVIKGLTDGLCRSYEVFFDVHGHAL